MTSLFRLLAQVSLRHDYYAQGICTDFSVQPSRETAAALGALGLLWKPRPDGLMLGVRVDGANHPAVDLPPDARWVFHLTLDEPAFLVATNLDEEALRSRRFHFTNLVANATGAPPAQVLNLTRPVEAYDSTRTYLAGDLARVGGNVFECLAKALNKAPDQPNTTFWVARGAVQYASRADLVPFRPRLSTFALAAPARQFRIRVFGLDLAARTLTLPVRDWTVTASASEPVGQAQVDLTGMPAGRYRVDINGEVFEAWFDDEAVQRAAFGVIELAAPLPAADAYGLLDAAGVVRKPEYVVRFANRRAFWQYLTPLHKVTDIRPSADHTQPSPFTPGSTDPAQPARKDFFISKRPLPLTEAAGEASFDLLLSSGERRAPRPDPRTPGMLSRTFDDAAQAFKSICTMRLNN